MKPIKGSVLFLIYFLFRVGTLMAYRTDYTRQEYALMSQCVDEIVDNFAKEMEEQFGFRCNGSGGSMPHDIQSIKVNFVLHRKVDIEEARELQVRAVERFAEMFNAHETVRPFLRDYPWNHNRAEVLISFRNEKGRYNDEGVRFVFTAKEKIYYFGPERFPNDIAHMKEEPYEEAKQIVYSTPSCIKPVPKKKNWFGWF